MRRPHLNRKLALEAPQRMPDGAGGYAEVWGVLGVVWGEVLPIGAGREVETSEQRLRITVRAAPQGAPSRPSVAMRFRDGARIYRIEAVTEAEAAGTYLICFAKEEVAA